MDDIVRLNKSHIVPAAETLTDAFQDYPLFAYFFPNHMGREKKLPHVFRWFVNHGVLHGEAYATSPKLEGVSIWLPSNKVEVSAWRMVQSGIFSIMLKAGVGSIRRMLRFGEYSDAMHRRNAPPRHRYFQLLGVDPDIRGKGYASALIKPILAKLDEEQLPCYLETHEPENVSIFQHYGFEVVEEGIIPNSEVTQWAMLRKNAE